MAAKYLWEAGAFIFLFLGALHLAYTFFTDKFSSKSTAVVEGMKTAYPKLTKETTLWKAWIGFNGSHSAGAIFIGVINLYLAIAYFDALKTDHFFFIFNIITVGFYTWLARAYWFKIPLIGVSITLICFIASYIISI